MTAVHKNAETQLIDFEEAGSYIWFVYFTFRTFNKAFLLGKLHIDKLNKVLFYFSLDFSEKYSKENCFTAECHLLTEKLFFLV